MKPNSRPVLLDASGCIGQSANATAAFPRASDLLAHMDRLGVERSVVWHAAAGMHHVPSVNGRLLRELDRTPGARGRLVPALAVSPILIYQPGELDGLCRQMSARGWRALKFKPGFGHTLAQLEPVLDRLRVLKPVLFLHHAEVREDDLLAVSERLPDISFVIASIMWGGYVKAFHLMRQRANILMESGWLHTWDAVEIVVRECGAERLVFGLGQRTHNGAAIAALMAARLSERDRALIAHGNLDHRLGLEPARPPVRMDAGRKPADLWNRLLAGRRLGVDVVDAHYHLGASGGYVMPSNDLRAQVAATLAEADRIGVRTVLASSTDALLGDDPAGGNLALARALRPCRDRIRPYYGFNPRHADELGSRLKRVMGSFVGFKTLCDYWGVPVTDPGFEAMLKYADEWRLPILYHTWDGAYDTPALLKDIVKAYPGAMFLLGHSGGGDRGRAEATELAGQNDNVYLEWCGSFCSSVPWEETLSTVSSRKVVFGTDGCLHGVPWELGRLLSLNVPDADLRPILGANMRRILAVRRHS